MSARIQNKRVWLAGGAVVAVLILLIGWFVVIDPQLSAASSSREQAGSAQMQNLVLQAKNDKLREQNDDAAALRAGLAAALAELPSDGGLPAFTRQLSAQASATSVVLDSVIVGAAEPVVETDTTTGGTETDSTDNGTTDSTDEGTNATESAPSSALVQITVTVTATGLGDNLQAFLREIQVTGPRRALVTGTGLTPAADNPGGIEGMSTLTLTLNVFSAPLSPTAQAALEKLLSGN